MNKNAKKLIPKRLSLLSSYLFYCMVCSHIEAASFNLPSAYTQVHKEECTQCFDNQVSFIN